MAIKSLRLPLHGKLPVRLGLIAALVSLPILAVTTVFWRTASFRQFLRGNLRGLSLSREGRLRLAPRLRRVFHSQQAIIWSLAADARGDVYLGTGHAGRVYRLTPAELRSSTATPPARAVWFTAPQPEIFALAVGPDGALYAGSSPRGKIYRINSHGQASVYFNPHARYIWSLAFSGSTLYAGTGDRGEIYKITGRNQGHKFFATRQAQVMTLAVAPDGDLLAGSSPGGLIFRITPAGRGFVLYNAPLEEIHQLAVSSSGAIYASAQGAAPAVMPGFESTPASLPALMPGGTVSVTVHASSGQPLHAPAVAAKKAAPAPALPAPAMPELSPAFSLAGMRSALYRISPDAGVDTVWSSRTQDADGLLPTAGGLLFSTDRRGRIYRLRAGGESTILAQTNQQETTRLLQVGHRIFATTANLGDLYRLGARRAASGTYISPVKDTGEISRWGQLRWRGQLAPGARIMLYTRSGNSPHPDLTWSLWAAAVLHQSILSPPARYIQWKAVLADGAAGKSPYLDEVEIPYLPTNLAPQIASFHVRVLHPQPAARVSPLMNQAEAGVVISPGTFLPPALRGKKGLLLRWQASDPDHDQLEYSIYFQAEGETGWTRLRRHYRLSMLRIGSSLLPDGVYRFKLVASDAPSNPPARAKTAVAVSRLATLDTTPPRIRLGRITFPQAGGSVVHFTAHDPISPLVRAWVSLDARPWRRLAADSGIMDSRRQSFTITLRHLAPGQHIVMLRVADTSGNRNAAKALVTVKH